MNSQKIIFNVARALAALIMLQTLFFKFTGAEESVYIFTKVGMEPYGRIGAGILELIASVLLFVPNYKWLGALTGVGLMTGAIVSHLTILGIDVMNDGGYLFFLAITVLICCSTSLFLERKNIPILKIVLSEQN
ncbi:MAG: DoxX family protein [Bacteroidia bacterium]